MNNGVAITANKHAAPTTTLTHPHLPLFNELRHVKAAVNARTVGRSPISKADSRETAGCQRGSRKVYTPNAPERIPTIRLA